MLSLARGSQLSMTEGGDTGDRQGERWGQDRWGAGQMGGQQGDKCGRDRREATEGEVRVG